MNQIILEKQKYFPTETTLRQFAKLFAKKCQSQGIRIYLSGTLGAGKTTWVRSFLEGLGYKGRVKSPTYSLVESYDIQGQRVHHFDLYRLKNSTELFHLGLEDYFDESAICLVEWPDHFINSLPEADVMMFFEFQSKGRLLRWEGQTAKGEALMER